MNFDYCIVGIHFCYSVLWFSMHLLYSIVSVGVHLHNRFVWSCEGLSFGFHSFLLPQHMDLYASLLRDRKGLYVVALPYGICLFRMFTIVWYEMYDLYYHTAWVCMRFYYRVYLSLLLHLLVTTCA